MGEPCTCHRAQQLCHNGSNERVFRQLATPHHTITALTAGLKCAPLMGPNTSMGTYNSPTVAKVFASSAMAMLPPAKRSAMMPEPTTKANKSTVPSAAIGRRIDARKV